jgi:chaperonin GroEL (HSP60 family)
MIYFPEVHCTIISNLAPFFFLLSQVVVMKSLENDAFGWGYNAATDTYENLFEAGILDPAKVSWAHVAHGTCPASILESLKTSLSCHVNVGT